MIKSYYELITETLNQRAIIDNRNVAEDLSNTTPSVLIAFNQACEFMRDMHNWKWNKKKDIFNLKPGQYDLPMPYGIVEGLTFKAPGDEEGCAMKFVGDLTAVEGCPSQWTHDWAQEMIAFAPAVSEFCPGGATATMYYKDLNVACVGARTDGELRKQFSLTEDVNNQFLNVPEYVYEAYARCVILKARVYLNEGAQTTLFPAQKEEWQEAYYGLMSFAKTPTYESERTEI